MVITAEIPMQTLLYSLLEESREGKNSPLAETELNLFTVEFNFSMMSGTPIILGGFQATWEQHHLRTCMCTLPYTE